jgi:hypothetical protein
MLPRMELLPVADQHRLRAAEGWLELGNEQEAQQELDEISSEFATHPEVLCVRWQISRQMKTWETCFEVARNLTEKTPKDPRGWIFLAQSFYYTGRHQEAFDLAVSKITTFPTHWPLYYDAACYASLTGRLPQAKEFLQIAMVLGDENHVKLLAAQDPDLEALRHPSV